MNPLLELLAIGIYVTVGILLLVFVYMCIGCCSLVETRESLHVIVTTKHEVDKSTQSPENDETHIIAIVGVTACVHQDLGF